MQKRKLIILISIALLLIAMILTSCCTTRQREVIVYKTKDSTAIHVDTTWRVFTNPADSISIFGKLTAYQDSLGKCKIKDTEGTTESGKIKVKYIIKNDSIFIECNTKPYEIKIAELTTTIEKFKEIYESYTSETTKVKNTSWFSFWQTWAALAYIALTTTYLILKAFKLKIAFTITPPFITITK